MIRAGGGILERLEGLVHLETLRDVLRALSAETVGLEAANEGAIEASAAADSMSKHFWRVHT